jgi:hypothetical protein
MLNTGHLIPVREARDLHERRLAEHQAHKPIRRTARRVREARTSLLSQIILIGLAIQPGEILRARRLDGILTS